MKRTVKKILIIKTGTTYNSIRQVYGDFEDFIIHSAGIDRNDTITFPIYQQHLPPVRKIIGAASSAIITGSHAMVTDMDDWSTDLCRWIRDFAAQGLPVLGICYGHQLLAQAWGGVVDYHPSGREIGAVSIKLTQQGVNDRLLGVLPEFFIAHVSHAQSVIRLPDNARVLAYNDFEPHHSFVIDGNVWGVQFHPEFTAGIMKGYIHERRGILGLEGYDTGYLCSSVIENEYGAMLLHRFVSITGSLS